MSYFNSAAIAIFISILSVAQSSPAGRESNGGMGVIEGNSLFLLDLYEYDIHRPLSSPKEENHLQVSPFEIYFSQQMRISAIDFNLKLLDLYGLDPNFADPLSDLFQNMSWTFTDLELPNTHDDYTDSDRRIPNEKILQLAVRNRNSVMIQKDYYDRLDSNNRLALLFHEALSLLYFRSLEACPRIEPTTKNIRRLVALIFSKRSRQDEIETKDLISKIFFRECRDLAFKPK